MENLFSDYKKLLNQRLDTKPLLLIGEDSIRYDFFYALTSNGVSSFEIEVEVPMDENCFIPRKNPIALRKEKPQIDLLVKSEKLQIAVEFGFFRENNNPKGTINKTAKAVKMFNDMLRLSLYKHFTTYPAYFICVADYKMIGHQMRNKYVGSFPSNYYITNEFIDHQLSQKCNMFDSRFVNKYKQLNIELTAKIVYNE